MKSSQIFATDVQYGDVANAMAAGVLFHEWGAEEANREVAVEVSNVPDYEPGKFFRRELPCLLELRD